MTDFPNIATYPYIALDLETTGLSWIDDQVFGVAIATPCGKSYYWDVRKNPNVIDFLKNELHRVPLIVNHNIKFDHHFLMSLGISFSRAVWCTQIAACIINEHEPSFSLDNLSKKHLGMSKRVDIYQKLADLFGGPATKNAQMPKIKDAPLSLVAGYAKQDAILALKLYEFQKREIEKQGLSKIIDLEHRLYWAVLDMERRGIHIDGERARRSRDVLASKIPVLSADLNKVCGFPVNINSPKDLNRVFKPVFSKELNAWTVDGTVILETDNGNPSFKTETLDLLDTPQSALVKKIRKFEKTKKTFLEGQILGNLKNSYVHPNINQTKGEDYGTVTGRLSYNSPGLQQIPARDKEQAAIVRPVFVPDSGKAWACWDYSQFEFRMFAHYIGDPKINALYAEDPYTDFHQMVADFTGLPRSARHVGDPNAKTVNLGLLFGMGRGKLAQVMGLPYTIERGKYCPDCDLKFTVNSRTCTQCLQKSKKPARKDQIQLFKFPDSKIYKILKTSQRFISGPEGEAVMKLYHDSIPAVAVLLERIPNVAKERGYNISIAGRHLRYPNSELVYKAPGCLYQGSSADCMKLKLIELYDYFKGTEGRLVLSVHDEFNCSIPKGDDKMISDVRKILERYDGHKTPIKLNVPIRTDFGQGDNWAVASGKGA